MNILISGVGGPTPIGIARSIRKSNNYNNSNLIGIDADRLAPGLYNNDLFDATYLVPKVSDSNYWEHIEAIVDKHKVDFAFIVPETEVIGWSRQQNMYDLPCSALIPDYDVAKVLYDKYKVNKLLDKYGLVPQTLKLESRSDLPKVETNIGYPFWVRINEGAGALGALKINTDKDYHNWLAINSDQNDFIASSYLPGANYACKLLFKDDTLYYSAVAERVGYLLSSSAPSGISGMCAHGRLINNSDIVRRAEEAVRIIYNHFNKRINGMFTVDFKCSDSDTPLITEINIRHISFTYAFTLGGANFTEKTLDLFFKKQKLEPVHCHFENKSTFIRGVDSSLILLEDENLLNL